VVTEVTGEQAAVKVEVVKEAVAPVEVKEVE